MVLGRSSRALSHLSKGIQNYGFFGKSLLKAPGGSWAPGTQANRQGPCVTDVARKAICFSSSVAYKCHFTPHSLNGAGSLTVACCSLPVRGTRLFSSQPRAVSALSQAVATSFQPVSLSNLSPGRRKYKRRRARGGGDKQAGRGHKGQKSRSGTGKPALFFEGGQTPFWKMLPRRGFKNRFQHEYDNVLLAEIDAFVRAGKLDPTRVITVKHLYDAGLLEKKAYNKSGVQVLAQAPSPHKMAKLRGLCGADIPPQFSIPVDLEVQRVSENARVAIEAAGGRVARVYYNALGMRALLRPEWFAKKARLVPRAVQVVPYKLQWRFERVGAIPAPDAAALEDVPPPAAAAAAPPSS